MAIRSEPILDATATSQCYSNRPSYASNEILEIEQAATLEKDSQLSILVRLLSSIQRYLWLNAGVD
ncbi:predicted protein [Uncinocarpus reesii 1704]|uniref:Uncharacterized protein n=1 Tax=Uncinocarpus reesii (strain UAMH 1704) TaxID=336963 RepID=C4JVL7_UNCRE|nr:uncharacterized protein UREG_06609 [Uncinocarpus reesii 1704]EEP81744.1 predicted protein [Uncinocarpus reesii 1704]